jgi:hypothetical protein
MIAGSFGVSAGMEASGGAAAIANLLIAAAQKAGGSGFILAAIYIATTLLSQVLARWIGLWGQGQESCFTAHC